MITRQKNHNMKMTRLTASRGTTKTGVSMRNPTKEITQEHLLITKWFDIP